MFDPRYYVTYKVMLNHCLIATVSMSCSKRMTSPLSLCVYDDDFGCNSSDSTIYPSLVN